MSDNKSNTNTTIIIAVIGGVVTLCAAFIAILPGILPYVIPPTPTLIPIATIPAGQFLPTITQPGPVDTPAPDVPSAPVVFTDTPPPTSTDQPTITPTETSTDTPLPPPTSQVNAYVGTWVNTESNPTSSKVKLVLTRLVIAKTGETTADFTACRSANGGETYVDPKPAPATIGTDYLGAGEFSISGYTNLRWAIKVKFSGSQLIATVDEYTTSLILMDTDTFQLKRLKPSQVFLFACQPQVLQQ